VFDLGLSASSELILVALFAVPFLMLLLACKHLPSILAALTLACMAVLIELAPDSTSSIIAGGCVAGSYFVLLFGRMLRVERRDLRRELARLEEKLAAVGSQNTLAEIRLAEMNLSRASSDNTRLATTISPSPPTGTPEHSAPSLAMESARGPQDTAT
jgi:hypothetical protein